MRKRTNWILAAMMAALILAAISCGHVSPDGSVRTELKEDMDAYQDAQEAMLSAMDSMADAQEFADSCWSWGCIGEAIEAQRYSCAMSEAAEAQAESESAQAVLEAWQNDPDLTADERDYIDRVVQHTENRMITKGMQIMTDQQGCGGCFGC
ncbi:MAG: hypothetical protein HDQ87_03535 [Clostridia bacterium]|nr:hypothetical protein [Clostridia bacterium]